MLFLFLFKILGSLFIILGGITLKLMDANEKVWLIFILIAILIGLCDYWLMGSFLTNFLYHI